MRKIGSILNEFLVKKELYLKIKGRLSILKWNEIVGQKISNFTYPISYQEGILIIGVVSPLIERELNYMKKDIIDKINNSVPDSPVKRIRFKLIEKLPVKDNTQYSKEDGSMLDSVRLEEEDLKWIENITNQLKVDDNLKKEYKELLAIYKKDQKSKIRKGYKKCKKCGALFKGEGLLCPVCEINDKVK